MFAPLRNRFGIPGVISIIALVFAMAGGAFAAKSLSSGGPRATSSAGKRGPRGPRGPRGKQGPTGPQGPAGAKGDPGAAGANGTDGAAGLTGATGPTGKSGATGATGAAGATGATGAAGVGTPGATGATGATGQSGFTETLPSGAIEVGSWSGTIGPSGLDFAPISFPIPLAAEMDETHVHIIGEGGTGGSGCTGGKANTPTVGIEKGHLCVYVFSVFGGEELVEAKFIRKAGKGEAGASTMGARVQVAGPQNGEVIFGTFAVRAP
jgi:hypothetical protein